MSRRRLQARDYTVGWICALPVELAAARQMLEEEDEGISQDNSDPNIYTLGRIDAHNVVLACLPAGKPGTQSAATVAAQMRFRFTSLRVGLMVGIGGGVPSSESDVRLGDVVISQPYLGYGGVVQHLAAFDQLASFTRDAAGPDVLFEATYDHIGGATCRDCNKEMEIKRPLRKDQAIHYGTIASGNQVMKDGITRDRISQELGGVLCFEMEAAGLMNDFPCLVVRGICDYADSHKNKKWQPLLRPLQLHAQKRYYLLYQQLQWPEPTSDAISVRGEPMAHDNADDTAQRRIERKLDQLYEAVRRGSKPSALFARPRNLEKELVDDNVTEVDVEENKDFINEWMKNTQGSLSPSRVGRSLPNEHNNTALNKNKRPQTTLNTSNSTSSGPRQAYIRDEDDEVAHLVSDHSRNDRSPSQASDIKHGDGQWSPNEDSESDSESDYRPSRGFTRANHSSRTEEDQEDRVDRHLEAPADDMRRSPLDQSPSHSDPGDRIGSSEELNKPHDLFKRNGDDIYATLQVNLIEALCGWHRVVQTIDDKHVKVSHPGPTPHDWQERFPGLGMPLSKDSDRRGDFIVDVVIRQPKSLSSAQKKDLSEILGRIDD
ncbi:unnamed protein product [Aureobasidium pullulans]|nr:unnamed protein product [Aureobasidium pullulans]